jgi:hypothetical protein
MSFKEVGRPAPRPVTGVEGALSAAAGAPTVALAEVDGAASADAAIAGMTLELSDAPGEEICAQLEQQQPAPAEIRPTLTSAYGPPEYYPDGYWYPFREVRDLVMNASPQHLIAEQIDKAGQCVPTTASDEELKCVTYRTVHFAREAAELLRRGNYGALPSVIETFWRNLRSDLDKLKPSRLPLFPPGDMNFYGKWTPQEERALRKVLVESLCGVQPGDRCVSVDLEYATLASGRRLTKAEVLAAVKPAVHPGRGERR